MPHIFYEFLLVLALWLVMGFLGATLLWASIVARSINEGKRGMNEWWPPHWGDYLVACLLSLSGPFALSVGGAFILYAAVVIWYRRRLARAAMPCDLIVH